MYSIASTRIWKIAVSIWATYCDVVIAKYLKMGRRFISTLLLNRVTLEHSSEGGMMSTAILQFWSQILITILITDKEI